MLFYLHLDCIDGKQARRTKSSSPLGQLFDHGENYVLSGLVVGSSAEWRGTRGGGGEGHVLHKGQRSKFLKFPASQAD